MQTVDPTASITITRRSGDRVLGRYQLERRLGAGAFGTVYLARDAELGRLVALKQIPCHDEDTAARAEREAHAAARLSHPGIVALYEAGRDDGIVYLASEFVEGRTLGELCADGALSDRDVVRIGAALCDALEHAHARGVVHRDVKPANIIVPDEPSGEASIAKLTDFGVAHLAGDDGLTRTGDVVGTLAYMSPEQADGLAVDGRTDLYALALVLYEALTGINPVRAGGAAGTARRVGARLPPISRMRRDLPRVLTQALDAAVLPDPAQRGSIADLRDALDATLDHASTVAGTVAPSVLDGLGDAWDDDAAREEGQLARGIGALTAGTLVALAPMAASGVATPQTGVLAAAGVVAALAVAVAPRAAWLFTAAGLAAWLVVLGAPGLAVAVLAAALPSMLLLWRAGRLQPSAALAAALGAGGLGLAWPALAGQAATPWRRGALGALGLWWLLLAESVARTALLLGDGPQGPPPAVWTASASEAFTRVLEPCVNSGALVLAGVWAIAAVVLPLVVRGRALAADLLGATLWSAAVAALTAEALSVLTWHGGAPEPRGLILGALVGGLCAIGAAAVRRRG
ncbi:unannotated protein [freshwater metagenome]|uniref:Unannotated protein n=1 Tax=freshwater metagenome TaxID=449393 RepID=A0A6J7H5G5_9ZZZZ